MSTISHTINLFIVKTFINKYYYGKTFEPTKEIKGVLKSKNKYLFQLHVCKPHKTHCCKVFQWIYKFKLLLMTF